MEYPKIYSKTFQGRQFFLFVNILDLGAIYNLLEIFSIKIFIYR